MKNILFFLISLLLISCSASMRTNTSKGTDIQNFGVIQKLVIADLDVKETKITGSATSILTTSITKQSLQDVKNMALADALKKANADILIEPIFDIAMAGNKIAVSVTGYPATYKNFRPITEDDLRLLQIVKTKTDNCTDLPQPRRKKLNIIPAAE